VASDEDASRGEKAGEPSPSPKVDARRPYEEEGRALQQALTVVLAPP